LFFKAAFIFVKARWPGRLEYREPLFLKYENEDEEMEFLDTRLVAQVNICTLYIGLYIVQTSVADP
jgi:hypothetical protein